jgi:hypothetical protein
MGKVVKISGKDEPSVIRKTLDQLIASRKKKKPSLSDYYGALPFAYEDGLAYQQKQRNEWE